MTNLREHKKPTFGLPEILKTAGHVAGAGVAATVGGVVAVTASGCCGGSSSSSSDDDFDFEAWADTDGAAGRINMAEVQTAFEQATDATDFENRVNEIYEGENPILIRVQTVGTNQVVEGWEDLNDDGLITDASDDELFSLTRPLNGQGQVTLQGHGSNSYYTHAYPPGHSFAGGMMTGIMMGTMMSYMTSPMRRTALVSHVRTYRSSPGFASRQAANRSYFAGARSRPGFGAGISPARNSFRGNVRSSGGSFRSGLGRSSGFRGGGR